MMRNTLKSGVVFLLLITASIANAENTSWCGPNGCRPTSVPQASRPLTDLPREVSVALQSIARVRHASGRGVSFGTASLIANRNGKSFFITCAHLFDGGQGKTTVQFTGQRPLVAKLLEIDRQHDLALLETALVRQIPIGVDNQLGNRPLVAAGFGGNGRLRAIQGSVSGYATPVGASLPSVRIRGSVRSGDSGGPVLNLSGQLVAVVWGERSGETFATFGKPLRRILSKLPKIRVVPRIEPRQPHLQPAWSVNPTVPPLLNPQPLNPKLSVPSYPVAKLPTPIKRPEVKEPTIESAKPSVIQQLIRTWKGGQFALGALSVGGPIGFAAAIFYLKVKRRKRKWHPIAVDTKPPPQQVMPETHYISYENDEFAKAHQWACEQLARKFPGSVEMLTSLDSLIRQQLAGRRDPS